MLLGFGWSDGAALALFLAAWLFYGHAVERWRGADRSLNMRMNQYRRAWMERALARDQRVFDASLMGTLQNGASFFASTSLIAMGGSLAFLRATDDALRVVADLPLAGAQDRLVWEIKVIGLVLIFGHAFFRFAWSYRLFNYTAILLGAMPPAGSGAEGLRHAHKAAAMNVAAGGHFNRGQRAIFFALAYLGWFVGPWALMATTALVVGAMWQRQFHSDALAAIAGDDARRAGEGP